MEAIYVLIGVDGRIKAIKDDKRLAMYAKQQLEKDLTTKGHPVPNVLMERRLVVETVRDLEQY